MQLKEKEKAYNDHKQETKEINYIKMQKMVGALILARGKNPSISSTPYHYGHHLVPMANVVLSHHKNKTLHVPTPSG